MGTLLLRNSRQGLTLCRRIRDVRAKRYCQEPPVIVRQATPEDFPSMSRVLIDSGLLSESVEYLHFHTLVDPNCLCVAELDEDGHKHVVGCGQGCAFSADIGFLNLLAVDKAYRGRGIAQLLARHQLDRLGDRNLVANASAGGLKILKTSVKMIECFQMNLYVGDAGKFHSLCEQTSSRELEVVPHDAISFSKLNSYDASIHVVHRPRILRMLIDDPKSCSFSCIHNGVIVGFARLYDGLCSEVCLYADDDDIARTLLAKMCPIILQRGKQVMMTSPTPNTSAVDLLKSLGIDGIFEMTRVYTKAKIELPLSKIYGLSNAGYFLA